MTTIKELDRSIEESTALAALYENKGGKQYKYWLRESKRLIRQKVELIQKNLEE